MKIGRTDSIAFLTIAILAAVFFWKFFFPVPQLLVTPDFGRSDAWHFSFPTKYFLSQSLKQNRVPLWSPKIGGGFPLFAEGQIGTFFIPNFILYKLFDPVIAYNLSLFLVPITIGWGMYVWLRVMGLNPLPSLFGGLTLAFSGPVITQLTHITLLQGFSLLPWVIVCTHLLAQKKSWRWVCILAVIISQQILAGFPQASVITMFFAASYFFWLVKKSQTPIGDFTRFGVAIVLSIGLSAVQLLPSFEFLQQSSARGGFSPQDAAYFSYPLKHLITFINPFQSGNPKFGTYPPFSAFDGSIFWENTGYIGIIPLAIIVLSLCVKLLHTRCVKVNFFFFSLLLSFLLMLGSHSPLYIVYSMWPFNLFRVPSRFLWIFVTSLVMISAMGMQLLTRRGLTRVALTLLLGIQVFSLMNVWKDYHATMPAKQWLSDPSTTQFIERNDRIYTIGSELVHNQTFLTKGWQDMTPYYALRNTIAPDSNLLWKVASIQVYAGRFLRRQALTETLLSSIIPVDTTQATVSAQAKKFLDIFGVTKVISAVPLTGLTRVSEQVYQNKMAVPRVYLATHPVIAQTFEEAVRKIQDNSFVSGKSVLLEQPLDLPHYDGEGDAHIVKEDDTAVTIRVDQNPDRTVLVLTDTFYPGWHASIDGKETSILPVNIRHRGVIVDPGNHTVIFQFAPQSLKIGALISFATLFAIAVASLLSFASVRTRLKVSARGLDRRNNHDT